MKKENWSLNESCQSVTQLNAEHSKSHGSGESQGGEGSALITLRESESRITIY